MNSSNSNSRFIYSKKTIFLLIQIISLLLFWLAIFIHFFDKYIQHFFGDISFEQLVWHLFYNTYDGVNSSFIFSQYNFLTITKIIAYFSLFFIIIFNPKKFFICFKQINIYFFKRNIFINNYVSFLYSFIIFIVSVFFFNNTVKVFNNRYNIKNYFVNQAYSYQSNNKANDFIKEHLYYPSSDSISFNQRKNVVIILVESLESTFSKFGLLKNLDNEVLTAISNSNFDCAYGTNWTIAALTAWNFGLPLKLPKFVNGNQYGKVSFLPGAKSVFDVLKENGWSTNLVLGTDSSFSGQKTLFTTHGSFVIKDAEFWNDKYKLSDENRGVWQYSDKFVFERLKEEYLSLKKQYSNTHSPFILLGETVDTHGPDGGYCPEKHKKYNDIRDSIVYLDSNLSEFIRWFNKNSDKDTVLIVLGDHFLMGNWSFLSDSPKISQRTIFNAFWGNLDHIDMSGFNPDKKVYAFDIAPTILEVAGAKWGNRQFGLGKSFFSSEPSELSIIDRDSLANELSKHSDFYDSLF